MKWVVIICAALVGGLVARSSPFLGFLIFGVGMAVAWLRWP